MQRGCGKRFLPVPTQTHSCLSACAVTISNRTDKSVCPTKQTDPLPNDRALFTRNAFLLRANHAVSLGILALNTIPLRVVHFQLTEHCRLHLKLCAVANDYDLRIGRIEIFLRGVENIGSCES